LSEKILAAIDIGTNSFHLVVAKVNEKGLFKVLTREKEVVRLGKSSTDMKYISEDAIMRALSTLKRFKLISDSYKAQIRAVATSATREALNKNEFIDRVFEKTEIEIEVVSGFEEARLIYLGVLQALPLYGGKILLIDVGGGSTEFLIGEKGDVIYTNSIKIGAVRLNENFFSNGKFNRKLIEEARLYSRSIINPVIREIKEYSYDTVVGTSGTILNLGTMIYAYEQSLDSSEFNFNNSTYSNKSLSNIMNKIEKSENISDLKNLKGLDADRVDIITAGAIILEQIFIELNIDKITLSNFALREGIILDTVHKEINTPLSENLNDVRYQSLLHLAENSHYDKTHCDLIQRFSNKIFDSVSAEYELNSKDKEHLEAASMLHDIGHSISHAQHHRHTYYLIRNSELLGFNDEEIEIIANIARYHRKSHPKAKHENFDKLSAKNKDKVRKLSGILRIADGLDRGHNSTIKDIEIEKNKNSYKIKVCPNNKIDTTLEIWGANIRKELFEESFGYKVTIE
jgi:exopolyphosphatase / guanosine-5'-triphosphate,3'-diphosphate pyrophosphatase